ncbi:hypothetical protein N7448_002336 [Penicillium atrosanguineum]|uniref:Mitochondrial fission process protein 1 n=1 Tax=Penicillium atrosanguineum TaxID=1132637 RepID=A0A9W9HDE7_9EURO|nr:uncharacterized protein N7443_005740 [Penicillium atrosanguineum]KAJ5128620.1 hypothetical protein N7526_006786 [Penicillium atrosanguineum]KAJ5144944.1 hypothetical protein N7448_002336 [Penicillium atrosanguineum]KAJ5300738.1 hypothetical protein N7443_005740 [Penicillium atrosanguineum]KAJ5311380.1 hypothetical protein N7476_007240 [Penicillium atrosanguineum]
MVWGIRQKDTPAPTLNDQPVTREKLPAKLQQLVDEEEDFYDDLYSPYSVDSTDTPYRYAAYANRIRTILLSAHRYVAYTSDIGESFRPVAHPWLVRSAYGISWAYLIGDVSHEGYKAYLRNRRALVPPGETYKDASELPQDQIIRGMATGNIAGPLGESVSGEKEKELTPWSTTEISLAEDYRMVMAKRALFQGIASMGLPAFTIHSLVRYSGTMVKGAKSTLVRTWLPIGLGLAVVPSLPYLFDKPVEEAVDWAFGTALRIYGGEDAVRPLPHHAHHRPDEQGTTPLAARLSWEEYKNEREKARELRQQAGGSSVSSWLGSLSGSGKDKKD